MSDKPRLVEVTDAELDKILADRACLSHPYIFSSRVNNRIHFFANADDMKAWRSQHTSGEASDRGSVSGAGATKLEAFRDAIKTGQKNIAKMTAFDGEVNAG